MDRNQCIKLINLYGQHSYLWDPNDPNYVNRVLRDKAWKDISRELRLSIVELKKKLESLLGSYRREKSRERRSVGPEYRAYKSRWYAYRYFSFMNRSKDSHDEHKNDHNEHNNDHSELNNDHNEHNNDHDDQNNELEDNTNALLEPKRESDVTVVIPANISKKPARLLPLPVRHRYKRPKTSSVAEEADTVSKTLRLLQQCAKSSALNDHYTSFGHYIANELRKYDPTTLAHVKNAICGIIFQADTGKFNHLQNTAEANELGNSILPDSSSNSSSPAASPRPVSRLKMPRAMTSQSSKRRSKNVSFEIPTTSNTVFVKSEIEEILE